MARLQVLPPGGMSGVEFFYHSDMIQKDIVEEKKTRDRQAAARARQQKR